MITVVCEGNWQDYEGGGDDVIAVFSSREKAIAFVEKSWPNRKFDGYEWVDHKEDEGGSHYWTSVKDYNLDEEPEVD